jgi:leucyl aminopeptidase
MDFFSRSGNPARMKTGCIILGVFDDGSFCGPRKEIESASDGLLSGLKRSGDLPRTAGHYLVVPEPRGISARRLLLIGCGKRSAFGIKAYRRAVGGAAIRLEKLGASDAILALGPAKASAYAKARHGVEAAEHAWYRFDELKTGRKEPKSKLKKLGFYLEDGKERAATQRGIAHGQAVAEGQSVARRLANLPSNRCTPSYLASFARKLAKETPGMKADILNEAQMKRLGMGSLLSVTAGSNEPAKLIVLNYRGKPGGKTVALVGKGITFDSGGISLKPPPGMDEMKFDMGGAAGVLGTMASVAKLRPAINVVAVVPACENMPSGVATKPGDIVKSMSGKTIEILNTDAEGRLILCDALTYSRRFKPDIVIDVATLTGACVIALGHHVSGLMTRSDKLADALLEAGKMASDRAWRLPLGEEYDRGLRSNFADFANVGGREGGAITAGCFLGRFTEGLEWAHLDIAGTAWQTGRNKGATGRPVPLLVQYLLDSV